MYLYYTCSTYIYIHDTYIYKDYFLKSLRLKTKKKWSVLNHSLWQAYLSFHFPKAKQRIKFLLFLTPHQVTQEPVLGRIRYCTKGRRYWKEGMNGCWQRPPITKFSSQWPWTLLQAEMWSWRALGIPPKIVSAVLGCPAPATSSQWQGRSGWDGIRHNTFVLLWLFYT